MMNYGLGNAMMGGGMQRDSAPQGLGGMMQQPMQQPGPQANGILSRLMGANMPGGISPLQQMLARARQPQQPQGQGGSGNPLSNIAKLAMMFI